jgi:hypothetical protein
MARTCQKSANTYTFLPCAIVEPPRLTTHGAPYSQTHRYMRQQHSPIVLAATRWRPCQRTIPDPISLVATRNHPLSACGNHGNHSGLLIAFPHRSSFLLRHYVTNHRRHCQRAPHQTQICHLPVLVTNSPTLEIPFPTGPQQLPQFPQPYRQPRCAA